MEVPLNSVCTVRVEYGVDTSDDLAFNLLHYQLHSATVISTGLPMATSPVSDFVLPALAQGLATNWAAAWELFGSQEVFIRGATAQKVYPGDRSTPYNYSFGVPVSGDQAQESLPMQDAVTILKTTGIGQRWGMGRVFVPGIPEGFARNGRITDAGALALGDLISLVDDNLTCTDGTNSYLFYPVVTNVPTTGFPRVNRVTTARLSDTVIKTQRRRRPGKGV